MYDFNLTVDPNYYGEALDALGMQRALEERGYRVRIHELPVLQNIKHPVIIPKTKYNINFHHCYHPSANADYNYLFYHDIHDKTDDITQPGLPIGDFQRYKGVFTPARKFAEFIGIDHLQTAADPYLYHKIPYSKVPSDDKCDVVFIGNNHVNRDSKAVTDVLDELVDSYNVHIYGNGWEAFDGSKGLLPTAFAKYAYSGAKVGLNIAGAGMDRWGLGTNRLYQMGACGLPTVSYKSQDYLESYNGSVSWATGTGEFLVNTEYLMDHDDIRKDMGRAILKRTTEQHLWKHRLDPLLEILRKPKQTVKTMGVYRGQDSWDTDLLIAIPGEPKDEWTLSLMNMMLMGRPHINAELYLPPRDASIANCRNEILKYMMAWGHRYVLMIDNDTMPNKNVLDCLLEDVSSYDMQVVSGWYKSYNKKSGNQDPLVYMDDGTNKLSRIASFNGVRPVKVARVAAGCLMISRRVVEALYMKGIKKPFVDTRDNPVEMAERGPLTEDYYFCDILKENGFDVMVDPRCSCTHIKTALVRPDRIDVR